MIANEKPTSHQQSDHTTGEMSLGAHEEHSVNCVGGGRRDALALATTTLIVVFVGAIVVLSIPYAVLSAPLPSSVDRLGLSIEAIQNLFFGRPWYLLVPSALFALWMGYAVYRWGLRSSFATSDETTSEKKVE
ncbi:MAG: hypothetical protein GTN81_16760 [Proteobacteria bacterium]|nr:hypothetical protein [Pseudomonadota bacterium]